MPNSAILLMNSSPSIRSICCLPGLEASSFACLVKVPVVMRIPFSMLVVSEPRKSRISLAPTEPLYLPTVIGFLMANFVELNHTVCFVVGKN